MFKFIQVERPPLFKEAVFFMPTFDTKKSQGIMMAAHNTYLWLSRPNADLNGNKFFYLHLRHTK